MVSIKSFCRIAHDDRYAIVAESAMWCLERALLCADVLAPYPAAWRDCYDQVRVFTALLVCTCTDLFMVSVLCGDARKFCGVLVHLFMVCK
jgi:hypothetical protein